MKYTKKQKKIQNELNRNCYEDLAKSKDFKISEIGKRLLIIINK